MNFFILITGIIIGVAIQLFLTRRKDRQLPRVEKVLVQLFNNVDSVRRDTANGVYIGGDQSSTIAAKLNSILSDTESDSLVAGVDVIRRD